MHRWMRDKESYYECSWKPWSVPYYLDSYSLSQALQVKPHDIYGYRPDVTGYRVMQNVSVPSGQALANPAFGSGAGTQYFIPNPEKYLEPITTVNLK